MDGLKGNFTSKYTEIFFIVAVVAVVAVTASDDEKASAKCYTSIESCQGLDIGGCIGKEVMETEYVPKAQCSVIDNITKECNTLKRAICNSEKIESSNWSEKAETFGKSCGAWKTEYNLNYTRGC